MLKYPRDHVVDFDKQCAASIGYEASIMNLVCIEASPSDVVSAPVDTSFFCENICAVKIAQEAGNVKNSVNLPDRNCIASGDAGRNRSVP